jgi:hypothetical protein
MDHYKQAENLVDAGLPQVAIAHALLAIVDVLRAEPSDDCNCGDCKDYELPEFLRPVKIPTIRGDVL